MSRFERRLKERLKDPLHRAAYYAADAEINLTQAIDAARLELGISQAELGERLERSQSAVSQFLSAENGITIERLVEYLVALNLGVTIEIHRLEGSESPPVVVEREVLRSEEDEIDLMAALKQSVNEARRKVKRTWVYLPAAESPTPRSVEDEVVDEQSAVA